MMKKTIFTLVLTTVLSMSITGCQTYGGQAGCGDPTRRTLIGAGGGAAAGAILDGGRGAEAGAIIGGLLGAGTSNW